MDQLRSDNVNVCWKSSGIKSWTIFGDFNIFEEHQEVVTNEESEQVLWVLENWQCFGLYRL